MLDSIPRQKSQNSFLNCVKQYTPNAMRKSNPLGRMAGSMPQHTPVASIHNLRAESPDALCARSSA